MDMGQVLAIVFTGLTIVFIALVILIIFVSIMGNLLNAKKDKPSEPDKKQDSDAKKNTKSLPAPVVEDGISDEIIAVISAAVAAMSDSSTGSSFVIRGIKKSKVGRPVWSMAGIQENTRSF